MKKTAACLAAVTILISLTACSDTAKDDNLFDENNLSATVLQETENTMAASNTTSQTVSETVTDNISEDEINTLIQGRRQIIKVIEIDTLLFDTEDKMSIDDFDYYRVIDEKYDEWDEWTAYVKSIYADEAAEMIFNNFKIIEINGKTYTNDGSKGDSISDEYTYEIVSETNDTVTILLKNTDNFTSETIETEIILVKTSNGWRIKNY